MKTISFVIATLMLLGLLGSMILSQSSDSNKVEYLDSKSPNDTTAQSSTAPVKPNDKISRQPNNTPQQDTSPDQDFSGQYEEEINLNNADKDTIISQCQSDNWKACEKLSQTCYERNFDDCFILGRKLAEIDPKRAIPYYRTACEQTRHAESCLNLAAALLETKSEIPLERILNYLRTACVDGRNSMACFELAELNPNQQEKMYYKNLGQKLASQPQ